MQPAIISGHTHRFTAPADQPEVRTLFVRADRVEGLQMLRSAWEVEQSEVGLLLAGAKVHLGINAQVHPVVRLDVADLPDDIEPVFTARRFACPDRGHVLRVEAIVAAKPLPIRVWSERPIVGGMGPAFLEAVEEIEATCRGKGIEL